MISFVLIYLVGLPIAVLLHEAGHAIGSALLSKEKVRVYLGPLDDSNKENFRFGKVSFHIRWAYYGFCALVKPKEKRSKIQRFLFLAGGPAASLSLALLSFAALNQLTNWDLQNFKKGFMYINLWLFAGTSIPVIYPKWMGPYAGHSSDGYQLIQLMKKEKTLETKAD